MVKNPPANAGDMGSIPWSGKSPGEENGNPLQYSCLKNPDPEALWETHVQAEIRTATEAAGSNSPGTIELTGASHV